MAGGVNNPSVLPSASHLPLHRGGYNKVTPSAARPLCGCVAPPSYIGLPQRFCEAKDLREKEEQASKPCPDLRRGWQSLPCSDALVGENVC